MAHEEIINEVFLDELIHTCLYREDIVDICQSDLSYSYIAIEGYKKIFKEIYWNRKIGNTIPTLGQLYQSFKDDDSVTYILDKVREMKPVNVNSLKKQLETYIKRTKFIFLIERRVEEFNKPNSNKVELMDQLTRELMEVGEFSLSKNRPFFDVFDSSFEDRNELRSSEFESGMNSSSLLTWGIPMMDGAYRFYKTEASLFIAPSGYGKTMYARAIGLGNSMIGKDVLYITPEDTQELAVTMIDCAIMGATLNDIRRGLDSNSAKIFKKSSKNIKGRGGSFKIVALEDFEGCSMSDVRNLLFDYLKSYGKFPDLLILDYLSLFDPGDGKSYPASANGEKMRKAATARKIKGLAMEMDMGVLALEQCSDIPVTLRNDDTFYITRNFIEGDKTLVKPFNWVFSHNQTDNEYSLSRVRVFCDKARGAKRGKVFRMATAFDVCRYYDHTSSRKMFEELGLDFDSYIGENAVIKQTDTV